MTKENQKVFGQYLKKLRKEKGLSLRQLEEKSGVSNVYLSYLERGLRSIPSPDILKKIHGPLDVPFEELMEKAGYISADLRTDLHPETLNTLKSTKELNELISNAADFFIGSVSNSDGTLKEDYTEYVTGEATELFNDPANRQQAFENLTVDEKITVLNWIIKDYVDRGLDPNDIFNIPNKDNQIEDNFIPILRVPVLGHIAAGNPIFADDQIDEWTEIPNMWNLKPGQAFVLKVKGDSMIGSRIFDGDRVVVKVQTCVENGEIAVVNVNGDEATLKRVKKMENGQVILYPDNPRYEPSFITNENARIIGKVIQVMFEPK